MFAIPEKKAMSGNGFAFVRFGAWKYPTAVIRRVFPAKYPQHMHFHDFPQVWYCHEGRYLHQIGENVYDCGKGSMIVIPAGVWHGFEIPDHCEADIFCIEVKYSLFSDTPPEKYLNAISNLFLPCFGKEIGHNFPEVYQLSPESQEMACTYLSDMAVLDFKSSGTEMETIYEGLENIFSLPELAIPTKCRRKALRVAEQKARPIVRTMIFMNENYAQKIIAEDLLWVAALCHTDFYKCFKRFTGLTFSDYLLQLRIARVGILLNSTTYSLSKIADLCGFGDAAHMSKSYKKHTGRLLKDVRGKTTTRTKNTKGNDHRLRERDAM